MSAELNDALTQALAGIQHLRASLTTTLQDLSSGVQHKPQTVQHSQHSQSQHSQHSQHQNDAKACLVQLDQNLQQVNKHFSTVEKQCLVAAQVPAPQNQTHPYLVALDPVADKSPLYSQLVNTYKWSAKTADIAAHATAILNSNSLRRTSPYNSIINKRLRKPPNTTSHNLPAPLIDQLIQSWSKSFTDMTISITRPLGIPAILKITIMNVLQATVVLRGVLIENVIIRGFGEDSNSNSLKEEVWTKSRYEVFQKVTDHANSAMQHFFSPLKAELSIKSFLTWLHSYRSLFSAPCKKCGKYLLDALPPTWRDNRTLDAYHDSCRL